MAERIQKLEELPDFSEDERIFVMSDYGGEHKTAAFNTYAFLICSFDKSSVFQHETNALREAPGLNTPFQEFAYKKLKCGPKNRALDAFLKISDKYIHGVLVTISVEKGIPSLFGPQRGDAQQEIVNLLAINDFGKWKPNVAEKLLRIYHALAMFLAVLTHSGQKVLWMSDRDATNEDTRQRTSENMQSLFVQILSMYTDNVYDIAGFAKPFVGEPFTSDLLSIADFAAGAIQDVLQSLKSNDVADNVGKRQIIRWLGTSSPFLSKLNLIFKMDGGKIVCGNVLLKAKN